MLDVPTPGGVEVERHGRGGFTQRVVQASVAGSCNSVGDYIEHGTGRRGSHGGEHFAVTRETIGNGPGLDARTTLMIRNIPNKYTQKVPTPSAALPS